MPAAGGELPLHVGVLPVTDRAGGVDAVATPADDVRDEPEGVVSATVVVTGGFLGAVAEGFESDQSGRGLQDRIDQR